MSNEINLELFTGEILDKYVKEFFSNRNYKQGIEVLNFSNDLIREVEKILFQLDNEMSLSVSLLNDLLNNLQELLKEFVDDKQRQHYFLDNKFERNNRKILLKTLSMLVEDEKQWVKYDENLSKFVSSIRKCIEKVLNAIREFQNNQMLDIDDLIEIMNSEYPKTYPNVKNQVFLSHAYVDRVYTLGLFLYFYDRGIYLYIDWMHQSQGLLTKKLKNNLIIAINNSNQLLFLRTLNSELGLQGGRRQIREWCAWEIGTFDYKSNGIQGGKFFIDRYRQNRQTKSKSQLIQDYQPLRKIQNCRLY